MRLAGLPSQRSKTERAEWGSPWRSRPVTDGVSAARIEEAVVVTDDGPTILTRFPAQELMVANKY
jgi:hypothetical protein